jgi:hypothetical protein
MAKLIAAITPEWLTHIGNVLLRSWFSLVSGVGTTTLGVVVTLTAFLGPYAIAFWRELRWWEWRELKRAARASFKPGGLTTLAIWVGLFGYYVGATIYQDHTDLVSSLRRKNEEIAKLKSPPKNSVSPTELAEQRRENAGLRRDLASAQRDLRDAESAKNKAVAERDELKLANDAKRLKVGTDLRQLHRRGMALRLEIVNSEDDTPAIFWRNQMYQWLKDVGDYLNDNVSPGKAQWVVAVPRIEANVEIDGMKSKTTRRDKEGVVLNILECLSRLSQIMKDY